MNGLLWLSVLVVIFYKNESSSNNTNETIKKLTKELNDIKAAEKTFKMNLLAMLDSKIDLDNEIIGTLIQYKNIVGNKDTIDNTLKGEIYNMLSNKALLMSGTMGKLIGYTYRLKNSLKV